MSGDAAALPITVVAIQAQEIRLPFSAPLVTGRKVYRDRSLLWLKLDTLIEDRAQTGHGECGPLPGWTTERIDQQQCWLADHPAPWNLERVEQLDRWAPDLSRQPTLRAGIETALLDALARHRNQPLATLLAARRGRIATPDVAVQYTLGAADLDATILALEDAISAGYDTVKLKVGASSLTEDIERIRAIRVRFPALRLRVDANAAWSLDEARRALDALPVELIEQPVADGVLPDLMRSRRVDQPMVAADESCIGPEQAAALIRNRSVNALVLKPAAIGGLLPASALLEQARRAGIDVILSNLMESAIGRSACAALAAAWPEHPGPHGLATGHWLAQDLDRRTDRINAGRLRLRSGPGIGFEPSPPA